MKHSAGFYPVLLSITGLLSILAGYPVLLFPAEPYLVRDIPGQVGMGHNDCWPAEDRIFFMTRNFEDPHEEQWYQLWVSDGTTEGTHFVLSTPPPYGAQGVGGRLFFVEFDGSAFFRLWVTDGALEGTMLLLTSPNPGTGHSSIFGLMPIAQGLLFLASKGGEPEQWVTDGTPAGTRRLREIVGRPIGPVTLAVTVKERLFLVAPDPDNDSVLWVTDLTPAGTQVLALSLGNLAVAGPLVFFDNGSLGVTDGTVEGTRILNAGAGFLTAAGQRVFFIDGNSLWVSDGTPAGTRPAFDPTRRSRYVDNGPLIPVGEQLLFTTRDADDLTADGFELWVTDGTSEGTRFLLAEIPNDIRQFVSLGERACFLTRSNELWVSDLTPEGTQMLPDLRPCGWVDDGSTTLLTSLGPKAFFAASDGEQGVELWETDGTPNGTGSVRKIRGGPVLALCYSKLGTRQISMIVAVPNGTLFFGADDGIHGPDLWALAVENSEERLRFHRGDPNSSGTIDVSDGITIFGFLFLGNPASLACKESADANNDGIIDISDGIYLLNWLFVGGPEPAIPGPTGVPCGFDPDPPGSPDDLGCESYSCN